MKEFCVLLINELMKNNENFIFSNGENYISFIIENRFKKYLSVKIFIEKASGYFKVQSSISNQIYVSGNIDEGEKDIIDKVNGYFVEQIISLIKNI
jgi:hypothetical protein